MKEMENTHKYLISSDRDLNWGIVVNTVGKAVIQSGYTMYPPDNGHPEEFYFNLRHGDRCDRSSFQARQAGGRAPVWKSPHFRRQQN